ncbi:MAG: DnaJ domain-containing protein [Lachnospiraceae bacterium]|nr:DnaJ domain-containing protein [Lachnospiraceae bacterium]
MESFKDYYKTLQVHYDAAPEIIKSAYKRLMIMYHPDSLDTPGAKRRFHEIEEAFEVLSDADKRAAYHKTWLAHVTNNNAYAEIEELKLNISEPRTSDEALSNFYDALMAKSYEQAYNCLTEYDKENISYSEFEEWREAISECFEMVDYSVRFTRRILNAKIGRIKYNEVFEFAITVTDLDKINGERKTETIKKYSVFDGVTHRVCLGINSLRESTMRYRFLARQKAKYDPKAVYEHAIKRIDEATGLLSILGFEEEASKEIARYMRYNRPFSLMHISFDARGDKFVAALARLSDILKTELRINDITARFDKNEFIVLLAETRLDGAEFVKQKLLARMEREGICYKINMKLLPFEGYSCLDDAISEISKMK